jgi:hypothetical protein
MFSLQLTICLHDYQEILAVEVCFLMLHIRDYMVSQNIVCGIPKGICSDFKCAFPIIIKKCKYAALRCMKYSPSRQRFEFLRMAYFYN